MHKDGSKLEVDTAANDGHVELERRVAAVWRGQEEELVPGVPGCVAATN
jgi:hypothetical protein